jgi:CheY-like chemotaxis protein
MANLLVVDDAALDRYIAGALLEEHSGWSVSYAEDGREALASLRRGLPDLILTDLQMPELNGLELVEAVRRDFPAVPVVLMTAHGSEEIAVAALRLGASSYVPKRNLARDLVKTVESLLSVTLASRNQQLILDCLTESELRFVLSNDPTRLQPLIGHFLDVMTQLKLADKNGLIRVGTSLHEALVNAIEHGNLEVPSALRAQDNRRPYVELLEKRRKEPPYRDRQVHVFAKFTSNEAIYVVRDEGPGFDPSTLPDPTDPINIDSESGRGVLLIRTFMDDVRFNATGNEITMIKRRKQGERQK